MLVARFAPGRGCADCGRGGAEVRPRSILVVDDKEDIREVLALLLGSRGHTVEIAPDGPAALKVVADFCPEFALVDLHLPRMDGYELARRLRARTRFFMYRCTVRFETRMPSLSNSPRSRSAPHLGFRSAIARISVA